ncbi:MAG TPA: hypothetical protein VFW28_17460 [Micropepsaceae bacterium]|nr:hypothetical protein [Micropepsaceae bacterium]
MGSALTADECLKQAAEYLELARHTSDPDLRNDYIKLARGLTELAGKLHTDFGPAGTGDVRPANKKPARPPRPKSE